MHSPLVITKVTYPGNSLYNTKYYKVRDKDSAINFFLKNLNSKQFSSNKKIYTQNQQ